MQNCDLKRLLFCENSFGSAKPILSLKNNSYFSLHRANYPSDFPKKKVVSILLVLSDLAKSEFAEDLFSADSRFFHAKDNVPHCEGCFGCWKGNVASCVKKDEVSLFSSMMSECSELLILSQNTFGSYSPQVKNVLDRSISYVLPDFTVRRGEMHHKSRYKNSFLLSVLFYGKNDERQKKTAERLVHANALNLNVPVKSICFLENIKDLERNS